MNVDIRKKNTTPNVDILNIKKYRM